MSDNIINIVQEDVTPQGFVSSSSPVVNGINLVQVPVSSTTPLVELVQPFIVAATNYRDDWGFNLINGSDDFAVYQKGCDNSLDEAYGATVVLGKSNTIDGAKSDVIVIGDNNLAKNDGVKLYGSNLVSYGDNTVYYGMYNSTPGYGTNVVIGAGRENAPFNALMAGIDISDRKFVTIGDRTTDVYIPVTTNGVTNMQNVRTYFATKGDIVSLQMNISSINNKIPATASSSNKLVDTAQMNAFALPVTTKYGAQIGLSFDDQTQQLQVVLYDQDGTVLSTSSSVEIGLQSLETEITNIWALIPSQASASNQLADKAFVNSSISTNTAYFIGNFTSLAELNAYTGTVTNNDYANVIRGVSGQSFYDRYTYNANTGSWVFNFTVNNTTFTSAQWDAINSGMTSVLRTAYGNHIANTSNPHSVTKSQVGLSNVDNVRQYSANNRNLGTTAPLMDGTAAVGTATTYSRSDHVHPSDTSKQDVLVSSINIRNINGVPLMGPGNLAVSVNSFMHSVILQATDGKITVNVRYLSNSNMPIINLLQFYDFLASTNGQLAILPSSFTFNDNSIAGQGEYILTYATTTGNYVDLRKKMGASHVNSWIIGKNESGWEVFDTVTQMVSTTVS